MSMFLKFDFYLLLRYLWCIGQCICRDASKSGQFGDGPCYMLNGLLMVLVPYPLEPDLAKPKFFDYCS